MQLQYSHPMPLQFKFFFFSVAFLFIHLSFSAVLAPVEQDRSTRLYRLSLYLKTPPQPTNLLLDLGASFNWVDCSHKYSSSTYSSVPCASPLCNELGSHDCSNNSCVLSLASSENRKRTTALALIDTLAMPITDGYNPGHLSVIPEFVFSCSKKSMIKGHDRNVITGLARSNFSLMAQVSTAFSLPRLFALCLSGSPSAAGVAFYGTSGPYNFLPQVDLSKQLIYTPLLPTAVGSTLRGYSRIPEEYFVGLTDIKVNGKVVHFDRTALDIDKNGFGGTKLSTITPYTTLHSLVYKPFIEAFVNESAALNLTVTQPVKPFSVCYDAADVLYTKMGPGVPVVDFVMQSDDVFWRIFGSNSMVSRISSEGVDVWCLAVVDGGPHLRSSMVIGGHQMVDNLLQFDLESNRLGFSSSVLVHDTMCANFNFTVNSNLR